MTSSREAQANKKPSKGKQSTVTSGTGTNVTTSSRTTAQKGGVIKTVVLPHEDFNKLAVEGQQLSKFMQEQEQLFNDTVNAY
jgi:hypothetical protein